MKVLGLDGKTYTLKLYEAEFADENRSKGHLKCRQILKDLYKSDRIFEEVELPGTKGLTADFIIPLRRLLIEVQGIQHYKFSPFFHKNKMEFEEGKNRDKLKKQWADLNNFIYLPLDYRNNNEWKQSILLAYS